MFPLLPLMAGATSAEPNCWAANVAEPLYGVEGPAQRAALRPLFAAMDTAEAMARPNPGLLALPEVRLRLRREVLHVPDGQGLPLSAVIHAHGFGPKAWGRGPCEVIPQADRLGPRAGISFFFNVPTATLNRWEHDDQLVSYLEGDSTPSFQGWPTFRECAVISKGRRLPWIPVTVGEMLAYFEREQARRLAESAAGHERALEPYDLAAAEREAVRIRPLDAKAADLLLNVARQRKAVEARNHAQLRALRQAQIDELAHLRETRRGMSDAALAQPYHLGTGRHRLPTAAEAARPPRRVVKLDPTFPWDGQRRGRIQLITVCAPQLERNPAYHAAMHRAVTSLDFARLAALLD
ncbi:hypothetical protein IP87_16990 [beta proteobacterium AAP121]|nr:hypothetical protein IP87_16990 [beta proteobacterium AAP121]